MKKILENRKIELSALAMLILLSILCLYGIVPTPIPLVLHITLALYYLIKLVRSFRHWKISKGVSFINAYLNWQILYCITAFSFMFMSLPGAFELTYLSLVMPQYMVFVILAIIGIRWKKRSIYWEHMNFNVYKALGLTFLCLVIFYLFNMGEQLDIINMPTKGWINL